MGYIWRTNLKIRARGAYYQDNEHFDIETIVIGSSDEVGAAFKRKWIFLISFLSNFSIEFNFSFATKEISLLYFRF